MQQTNIFWLVVGFLMFLMFTKRPMVVSLITTWKRKQKGKQNLKNWLGVFRITLCAINTTDPYRPE